MCRCLDGHRISDYKRGVVAGRYQSPLGMDDPPTPGWCGSTSVGPGCPIRWLSRRCLTGV